MPNAIIAAGMDTSIGNVHQQHDHNRVEDRIVVVEIREATEVDAEKADEEVVEEDHNTSQ